MLDMVQGMAAPAAPAAPGAAPGADPSMYEARKAQIASMPPGPEKEAALLALARDYASEMSIAEDQTDFGMEAALSPMAKGTHTGGKYGTYVGASPVEHLANGLRNYQGYKSMGEGKQLKEELAKMKQQAVMDALRSGLGSSSLQTALPGRTGL